MSGKKRCRNGEPPCPEVDAAADTGTGTTTSASGPADLAAVEARVSAALENVAALEASAASPDGPAAGWAARLQAVRVAAAATDAEYLSASRALAAERYPSSLAAAAEAAPVAEAFHPEPPGVTVLTELSARTTEEERFLEGVAPLANQVLAAKKPLLDMIKAAKASGDKDATRALGRLLNSLGLATKALSVVEKPVGSRISLAIKRLADYRAACTIRELHPAALTTLLRAVPPSSAGYTAVCDYYRLSDSRRYSFGRQLEGPQHFVDIRRNVAVLLVVRGGRVCYSNYAVSGVGSPWGGSKRVDGDGGDAAAVTFATQHCEDGLGESYDRQYDAEYRLITDFVRSVPDAAGGGYEACLWSKKPLCASCADVLLKQVPVLLTSLALSVVVDEEAPPDSVLSVLAAEGGGRAEG